MSVLWLDNISFSPEFAHVGNVGGNVGFDQVLGFTNVKLAATSAFYLVDHNCGFVSPLVDADTVDFVRVPTVAFSEGNNFIKDAFCHFLVGVRE